MEIKKAQKMATDLMRYHGLHSWTMKFDNPLRRLGMCNHTKRVISLGIHATTVNTEAQVLNTILHEIAHALVGGSHNHDMVWRLTCIEIGGDGERCSTIAVKAPAKYKISCQNCLAVFGFYRRPRVLNNLAGAWCNGPKCGRKAKGQLIVL